MTVANFLKGKKGEEKKMFCDSCILLEFGVHLLKKKCAQYIFWLTNVWHNSQQNEKKVLK